MNNSWHLQSWQSKPISHGVQYGDQTRLEESLRSLAALPPLVTSWEVDSLKQQLAAAARGEMFMLQGGDCSEKFEDCRSEIIANKLKILLQMSFVLVQGSGRKVIRIGRFAGQYAKPRSSDEETIDGVTLPSYLGDLVNRKEFTAEARRPDSRNLLQGYGRAALTLNFIRALVEGGFADLHHPEQWNLSFVEQAEHAEDYHRVVNSLCEAISFLETISGRPLDELTRVDFYASHEGLNLHYEQAQTRQVPRKPGWYNLSTHFPWIGDRTRALDGAHVEYFRGIRNPVGVKVGPSMTPDEIVSLMEILNPEDEPGRLTFIHRFGVDNICKYLPPLIEAVKRTGRKVLWCCDPTHGNTTTTDIGIKTRCFSDILGELDRAFDVHSAAGSILGGVHFELTGDDVTECTGGSCGLTEADLSRAYESDVDPRLNYEQALEVALLTARRMNRDR